MEEKKIVSRLSRVGIFGNVFLVAFKLFAGITGKSGAMVSDAIHSLSDVFATLIACIGVRMSRRQEDAEHPYGHERLECVASLLLGLILGATGLGIGYAGVRKLLFAREALEIPTVLPLIAAVVSVVVKEAMFWYTMYYARRLNSPAFKADAWHHRSDALSSVGSFVGISLAKLGLPAMDSVASLIICALILKVAFEISRDAVAKMLDTSCGAAAEADIRRYVEAQPGVDRVDLLHTRQFGNKVYVDLEIAVAGNIPLADAHAIAERVHGGVERQFPDVKHVMIHVNPSEEGGQAGGGDGA